MQYLHCCFKYIVLCLLFLPLYTSSADQITEPITNSKAKQPVIITIDGMCRLATFVPDVVPVNNQCWTNYLKDALAPQLPQYLVASFQWTGDTKDTQKVLSFAEKTIRGYYEVAKNRGVTFEIIAHSWGTVLSYIVLKKNPDIKVDTFITLGSPLKSQEKVIIDSYTKVYAGLGIQKPSNVKKWVNYWAWNDLISGHIEAADKNIQIDSNSANTDYQTRLIATKNFHSKYYSEWKTSIVDNLAINKNVLTKTSDGEWIELRINNEKQGFKLTSDGILYYYGQAFTPKLKVHEGMGKTYYAPPKSFISPINPNNSYAFIKACDSSAPSSMCWFLYLLDINKKRIIQTFAGKYGPEDWVMWSPDGKYAVLTYFNHGFTDIYRIDLKTGDSKTINLNHLYEENEIIELVLNSFYWLSNKNKFYATINIRCDVVSMGDDCNRKIIKRSFGIEGDLDTLNVKVNADMQNIGFNILPPFNEVNYQDATVSNIIDGDTLEIFFRDKIRQVRLIGIDTPEVIVNEKTQHDANEWGINVQKVLEMGEEATRYVKSIVKKGDRINIEFEDQMEDTFKRLLGYVYLSNGTFLNADLLKKGYARFFPRDWKNGKEFEQKRYHEEFQRIEEEARINKVGFWKIWITPY